MFLPPAAFQGQFLPSAVLMKTCLKQELNQHLIEGRSWPRCVQAKRLRGSAGIQAKMGISSKGGHHVVVGFALPACLAQTRRGFAPSELPMPQAATSAGHTQLLQVYPHQIFFTVPNIIVPIGRARKCFCNADNGTNSTTVQSQLRL